MPGYFKPEHFIAMFEYVAERGYEREPFAQYLKARATENRRRHSGVAGALRQTFFKFEKTTRIGRGRPVGVRCSC